MATLGTKLVRLRKNRGLSQTEVAGELEVSQPAYHKWESDEAKPSLENIVKISRFYEVELTDLLEDIFSQTNTDNKNSAISIFGNPTVNNSISENFLDSLLKNQDQITHLIEKQNQLIEALLKK